MKTHWISKIELIRASCKHFVWLSVSFCSQVFLSVSSPTISPAQVVRHAPICEKPYVSFCEHPEVKAARLKWASYREQISSQVKLWQNQGIVYDKLAERAVVFNSSIFDSARQFLMSEFQSSLKGRRPSPRMLEKMKELSEIGLETGRLDNQWNGHYSPRFRSIDLGHASFVEDPDFLQIVIRVARHEISHSVDPVAYFQDDIEHERFVLQNYPFANSLNELLRIYPVGYNLECLKRKRLEGAQIHESFLEEITKNPFFNNNSYENMGCGNGYASEAFADFMAHKISLNSLSISQIQKYVFYQAVHLCSGQPIDPLDTHPPDRDRFERILFSFPQVRAAFSCK
jgi:hypothetical protein